MRRSALLFDFSDCPTPVFATFMRAIGIPGDDLPGIDDALQDRFFQKGPDGQPLERWELEKVQVSCPPNQFRRHLAACGFILATTPEETYYTRAAWPGALVTRAAARLTDHITAWNRGVRWSETIVFGGKRPLQPQKEGFIDCCQALKASLNLDAVNEPVPAWKEIDPTTELDMMKFLWKIALMPPGLREIPIIFVDAPMKPPIKDGGHPVRPTTEDTINEWLGSNPTPGSILLSSGAPYGMAQDEAFWTLLGPPGHTVETFGHAAPDLPIENLMREVAGCVHRIRQARLGS